MKMSFEKISAVPVISLQTQARIWATIASIVLALALPQLFHGLGVLTGSTTLLGHALLPMQLPVMLCGFIAGPVAGFVTGLVAPVVATLTSGMPTPARLPFMMCELACYGCVAGLLIKTKLPLLAQIVLVQLSGHVVLLAVNAAIALATSAPVGIALVTYQLGSLYTGLPGLILQLVLIPVVLYSLAAVLRISSER